MPQQAAPAFQCGGLYFHSVGDIIPLLNTVGDIIPLLNTVGDIIPSINRDHTFRLVEGVVSGEVGHLLRIFTVVDRLN